MAQYANANPGITGAPDYWDDITHLWPQLVKQYGNKVQPKKAGILFLGALFLCASEFSLGWFVSAQIVARAAVGCVCFLGFSQVLPPNLALSEAQRFAIWELL
jgi:hypothetical protein